MSGLTSLSGRGINILLSVIGISVALIIFYFGVKNLRGLGGAGTTSALGKHWAWYDRMTYKPYKGYKRYRSRAWNLKNTA